MNFLRTDPTLEEREAVLAVAAGRIVEIGENRWPTSPLLAMTAGYLAVEETWPDERCQRVLDGLASHIASNDDPLIVAGAATRAAVLDLWWADPREVLSDESKALDWAKTATVSAPEWVLNWLVLCDCHLLRREFDRALEIAEMLALPRATPDLADDFDRAFDALFAWRVLWNGQEAANLLTRVREESH